MSDYEGIDPAVAVLASHARHVGFVRLALLKIRHAIETRSEAHDLSKYGPVEFPGFARINATARQHKYGSDEYRAALKAEKSTIAAHQEGNSHHPEFHADLAKMPWLDIVEMVCDWWAATKTYGQTPWVDVLEIQRKRWPWSESQWWLIEQVSRSLNENGGSGG